MELLTVARVLKKSLYRDVNELLQTAIIVSRRKILRPLRKPARLKVYTLALRDFIFSS